MNNTPPKENTNNQEIDLVYLFRKIKGFFQSIRFGIFRFINFCLKKIVFILSIIIIGGVVGFFIDKNLPQQYKHEAIVAVNFESAEYLYKLANKKKVSDLDISKVLISPVYDLFPLVSNNEINLRAFTALSDVGYDFAKYKKGTTNILLYRYHFVTIYTKGKNENENVISDFLKVINDDPYFVNRQKIEFANNQLKIEEFKKSIQNINLLFEHASKSSSAASVDITNYNQMDELTKTKSLLLKQLNTLEIELAEQKSTLYPTVVQNNVLENGFGYIIKLPVLGLFFFFIISWFVYWFKKTKQAYLKSI